MASNISWEFGGDFPWPQPLEISALMPPFGRGSYFRKGVFFGTGRAAMLGLLEHGRATRGWRRLWTPSYFCPRVMDTIEQAGWNCPRYVDTPLSGPAGLPTHLEPGDVVLRMNFFGWRGAEAISWAAHLDCDVIEDHSHDPSGPWAIGSRAAYCVASLRKTLPLPDGGWLWSPSAQELPIPGEATDLHLRAAGLKIAGMTLKQHYRAGVPFPQKVFRELLVRGEALLGTGSPGGMHPLASTMLQLLCPLALAERRRKNFTALFEHAPLLKQHSPVDGLPPGCTPFALVLVFESTTLRDRVRAALIEQRLYPSLIWSLPQSQNPQTVDFGNRSLTLPIHFQYSESDVAQAAHTLRTVLNGVEAGGKFHRLERNAVAPSGENRDFYKGELVQRGQTLV